MTDKNKIIKRYPFKSDHPGVGFTQYEIVNNSEYCAKIIFQKKGTTTPAHHHKNKHESFMVLSGKFKMIVDNHENMLMPGEVISVSRGIVHTFTAIDEDSAILEISTPSTPDDSYFSDKRVWNSVNIRRNEGELKEWPFIFTLKQ